MDESKFPLFQNLTDKAYAVWQKTKAGFTEVLMDLDRNERNALVLDKLIGQVQNGGFSQWIDNGYATEVDFTFLKHALQAVGTDTAMTVLRMAERAVKLAAEREGEEEIIELDELDTKFYELDDQLILDIEAYFVTRG